MILIILIFDQVQFLPLHQLCPLAWNYWDTQGSQAEFDKFFGSNSFASMSASDISGDIVTASEAITAVQDLAYYYTRIRSVTYYTYYNEGLQHQGTAWSAMSTDYYSNLNCTLDITQNEVVKLPAFDDLRSTLVNLPSISYTYKYSGSYDEHGRSEDDRADCFAFFLMISFGKLFSSKILRMLVLCMS